MPSWKWFYQKVFFLCIIIYISISTDQIYFKVIVPQVFLLLSQTFIHYMLKIYDDDFIMLDLEIYLKLFARRKDTTGQVLQQLLQEHGPVNLILPEIVCSSIFVRFCLFKICKESLVYSLLGHFHDVSLFDILKLYKKLRILGHCFSTLRTVLSFKYRECLHFVPENLLPEKHSVRKDFPLHLRGHLDLHVPLKILAFYQT